MVSSWNKLPKALEPTSQSSEEIVTYSKAILYRRIVFAIVDLLFRVIIIVLSRIACQIDTFKGHGPNGTPYPNGIKYFP